MTIPEQKSGVLGFNTNLNTKENPFIQTTDFYKFDGWNLSEGLAITKRQGFQKFNSIQLVEGTTPASTTGLWEYVPSSGTAKQVATTLTGLYIYNTPGANQWNAISLTGAGGARTGTIDNLFDSIILLDQMYIGNGIDTNIRFDANAGTPTAYQMGITASTTAVSVTQVTTTTGNLDNGVYAYQVTYMNALNQESNPCPLSASITVDASHKQVALSNIPVSSDPQVTTRNIYRTAVNGAIPLFLVAISNNTATTYTDNLNDSNLGSAVEGFANGVPPKFSMIDVYQGVAFMAGDPSNLSRIWFSGNSKPACVDSNDFRDLDPNDGDTVTGLKKYLTTLVAFKNGSIWNATGSDRTTFGFTRTISSVGSVNNASIVDVPVRNVLAFMSPDARFYFYDGVNAVPQAISLEPTLKGLNFTKLSKVVGCVVPSLNQCRWIVPNGGSNYCNLIIWYDYILDKWGTTTLSAVQGNFCAKMKDVSNKASFYLGGVNTGYVYVGDTGGTDDGTNISCLVTDRGHPNPNTNPENNKSFSHLFVFFKPTAGVTLNVYCYKNDPDGTPISLGTIDASMASGQYHIHLNKVARRLYIEVRESSNLQGLVVRGWQLYYKDVGQHNAP